MKPAKIPITFKHTKLKKLTIRRRRALSRWWLVHPARFTINPDHRCQSLNRQEDEHWKFNEKDEAEVHQQKPGANNHGDDHT